MFIGGAPFEQTANLVLAQQPAEAVDGEMAGIAGFGFALLPVLIAGSSLILGGGTLWHLHERHTEKTEYQECLEKYTAAPFNMSPEEAALVCTGEVKPKGFQFGLNAPTFLLVAGSVFGLWYMSQLFLQAAKP